MRAVRQALESARSLLQSRLLRNTSTLVIYLVIGYGVTMASSPILSRLYTPEAFGLYGTFLTFPTACLVIAALNFDTVAPAPARDEEAANVAVGAVAIAVIMSMLLTLVYLAFISKNVLGYGALPPSSAVLAFLLLLAWSLTSTTQYWCIRKERFQSVGIGGALGNIIRAVAQVGLGLTGLGWLALSLGELAGRLSNAFFCFSASRKDFVRLMPDVSVDAVWSGLKSQRRFATVLLPPMAVDAILSVVAVPVIGSVFGLAAAGQYFLMKRVVDMPASLVSRTVADAFYSRISDHARVSPDQIRPLLLQTFFLITGASAICLLPVLLFGPSLFALVFGRPWKEAGLLAAIMVPALVISLGASPVARVFAVTRAPLLRYAFTMTNLIGTVLTLTIAGTAHLNIVQTIVGLSLAQFIAYGVYFISAYMAAGDIRL